MPVFRFESFKRLNGEEWLNRYHIRATDMTAAIGVADSIAQGERTFHSNQVTFTGQRVSDLVAGNDVYTFLPTSTSGLVPGSSTGGLLPLWNVVKVYWSKGFQRPDFKLYRGVIGEANTEAGLLSTTLIDLIDVFTDAVVSAATPYMVSEDDEPYISYSIDQFIRQRDLHRRARRQATPPLVTPG